MKRILGVLVGMCLLGADAVAVAPKAEAQGQTTTPGQVGAQWKLARTIEVKTSARKLAISPNSALVALDGWRRVDLWNTDTGEHAGTLFDSGDKKDELIEALAFSPGGDTLAVTLSSEKQGRLALFDVAAKKEIHSHPLSIRPGTLCFSHDGKYLAYSVGDYSKGRAVEILDVASREVVLKLEAGSYSLEALAWQEGDKFLVGAGGGLPDNTFGPLVCEYIRWDLAAGRPTAKYTLSPGSSNVVFNETGTLLATMGGALTVENGTSINLRGSAVAAFFIPQTNEEPTLLTQMTADFIHRKTPNISPNMAWSPDSRLLAIPQGDFKQMNLLLWDGHSDTAITPRIAAGGELKNDGISIYHAAFDKSGDKLVVSDNKKLLVWRKGNDEG